MGYKLAGFRVLGGVEIDPQMAKLYEKNHKPEMGVFLEGIKEFNGRLRMGETPEGLRGVDILDGSPPCSSFSMAGAREKKWGKNTRFREGQAVQVLDDLFFDFLDTAELLRPKVVVAENVKGMLAGNAKGYVCMVMDRFEELGYKAQIFLLNSARMGVPQKRERIFFVASRKDLGFNGLSLDFSEDVVPCGAAIGNKPELKPLSDAFKKWWIKTPPGKSFSVAHPKGSFFNTQKLHKDLPAPTVIADGGAKLTHWEEPSELSGKSISRLQTFPDDYDFGGMEAKYVCGMSVPPFMMQRVADQIRRQWFE